MAITDSIANLTQAKSLGGALSSISSIGDGASGIIKKIRSLAKDQTEPTTIKDLYTNGFLVRDSQFKPDFFARTFDEPTYLTFKVEFNFGDTDAMYRNMAYNNNGLDYGGKDKGVEHAMFNTMYDYMPEPFLLPHEANGKQKVDFTLKGADIIDDFTGEIIGKENDERLKIDVSTGKTYSTESYLDYSLGEHGRASLLHNFKLALKDIQDNFPYYLKSISGVDTLFKVDTTTGIRLKDASITLDCYEALDLRITQLLNMYKKIVWDDVYQRWVLPDMMRYFNMKIYISEIRLFHDFVPSKPKNENFLNDFSNSDVRNSTVSPLLGGDKKWYDKMSNGINTATAISNTYLGTKSHLTKAINAVASVYETGKGLYNDIAGAITDLNMCNHAFNEVMPTICIDCHMCEFDITDTMNHLNSLKSARVTESPTPKIKIKVGQANDTQIYPLNASLKYLDEDGYFKTVTRYKDKQSKANIGSMKDITDARNNPNVYMYAGNYISDDALRAKYVNTKMGERLDEYIEHLENATGRTKAETILNKRMNRFMRNDSSTMKYPRGHIPQNLATMSLIGSGIQEAQAITKWATDSETAEYIIGTHSTSTSPDRATVTAVRAVGETLQEALDRIYNGEELQSMALSEQMKNKVAKDMFDEYMNTMYMSTATQDSVLKQIISAYKDSNIQSTENGTSQENEKMFIGTDATFLQPIFNKNSDVISIATQDEQNKRNLTNIKFNPLN